MTLIYGLMLKEKDCLVREISPRVIQRKANYCKDTGKKLEDLDIQVHQAVNEYKIGRQTYQEMCFSVAVAKFAENNFLDHEYYSYDQYVIGEEEYNGSMIKMSDMLLLQEKLDKLGLSGECVIWIDIEISSY